MAIKQKINNNKKDKISRDFEIATFAGGCFWCSENDFQKNTGILNVTSGYAGGKEKNPSYEQVSSGRTGHVESIQVAYNPSKITYNELLGIYWKHIDPTDEGGQFADRGKQYKTAIFYHNEKQKELAEKSKNMLEKSGRFNKKIITEIKKFTTFYPAEFYHQDYYKKNPIRYKLYRMSSGRDDYIKNMWGGEKISFDDSKNLKKFNQIKKIYKDGLKKLTKMQYHVTQDCGTEPAFNNEYWDNKQPGIYVDIVSGEPLFSSKDKYDSGTGWPSFTKPLESNNIVEKPDYKLFMKLIEVKSKNANSHLGHVFDDGPKPTGKRYCMNSAALKFIAKEDLKKEGYGEYLKLFKDELIS